MRTLITFLFFLTVFTLTAQKKTGHVYKVEQVPDPKNNGGGYISDPDGYLSSEDKQAINAAIRRMEDSSTAQVAVVVLHSIGEDIPKDFATKLFNKWGIGQSDVDNGLLILTVIDQRRTEFETGSGLEAVLPDVTCYRIATEQLVPFFKEGKYGAGLLAGLNKISETIRNPNVIEEILSKNKGGGIKGGDVFVGYSIVNAFFHLLTLFYLIFQLGSKKDAYDKYFAIRKGRNYAMVILFPIPFLLIWYWIGRKMKDLRYQPRYSKKTGALMTLVPEDQEDAYMEKGQITEEEIGTVDYDVWVTEDGQDVTILRYKKKKGRYSECPNCKYLTYLQVQSRTISSATTMSSGQREVIMECKNCQHRKRTIEIIPQISSSSGGSGGSSSGGGSWGGGSSGGGGGGASW
jgi:uncharacterized protein